MDHGKSLPPSLPWVLGILHPFANDISFKLTERGQNIGNELRKSRTGSFHAAGDNGQGHGIVVEIVSGPGNNPATLCGVGASGEYILDLSADRGAVGADSATRCKGYLLEPKRD